MEFCTFPAQRSKKQKDVIPDSCYRRLKGILFFNRHTPISNNKLKILLDERKDLSSALEDASTERRLPQEFRTWLEKCHRELDKEVKFPLKRSWLGYARKNPSAPKRSRTWGITITYSADTRPLMSFTATLMEARRPLNLVDFADFLQATIRMLKKSILPTIVFTNMMNSKFNSEKRNLSNLHK